MEPFSDDAVGLIFLPYASEILSFLSLNLNILTSSLISNAKGLFLITTVFSLNSSTQVSDSGLSALGTGLKGLTNSTYLSLNF